MAEFTKGPYNTDGAVIRDQRLEPIAVIVRGACMDGSETPSEANGILLASAPELVDALRGLLAFASVTTPELWEGSLQGEAVKRARTLLLRVEGGA